MDTRKSRNAWHMGVKDTNLDLVSGLDCFPFPAEDCRRSACLGGHNKYIMSKPRRERGGSNGTGSADRVGGGVNSSNIMLVLPLPDFPRFRVAKRNGRTTMSTTDPLSGHSIAVSAVD